MEHEIEKLIKIFPPGIAGELCKYEKAYESITEIRIRRGRPIVLTCFDSKIKCDHTVTKDELDRCIQALCSGSLHAHGDTIAQGYISLENGVRAGICGRAVTKNNEISAVYDYTSVNIRIPRNVQGISGPIVDRIAKSGYRESILIYSSPGMGKTTLIRDIAAILGSAAHKVNVAVIDSRCEIADMTLFKCENADIFENYPKAKAIEIAVRTMSAEYVICDEIGTYDEAKALLSVQNSGVPVIATAHSDHVINLLMRPNIRILHEACCFDTYVGIRRIGKQIKFSYTSRDEIV